MPSPKSGYTLPDGSKCPGVTTVIGRWKDSGGLMQWAFKQGKEGRASLYEKAEEAADIGTAAHAMVETHVNGDDPEIRLAEFNLPGDGRDRARKAFDAYLKWAKQTHIKILSRYQELQLVCPEYKFGGTPDAIGEIDGQIVLLDWKTSRDVYRDYLIQLAAYGHLIENGLLTDGYKPTGLKITGGFHLCRFAKDFDDFGHHYYGELDLAWQQFLLFRKAYDIDKVLKDRSK